MEITGSLISRFLEGQCSPEEKAFLLEKLEQDPYLLDAWIDKEEWDAVIKEEASLPLAVQQRVQEYVLMQTTKKNNQVLTVLYKKLLPVAAILVIAIGGWLLYRQLNTAAPAATAARKILPAAAPVTDTTIGNNGKEALVIRLKEGSVVRLAPGSAISFAPDLAGSKRNIRLQGEAYFKVARDERRPFTVFSHGVATTALGTSFTIKAYEEALVKVILHTGKVVVRNTSADTSAGKEVYLLPGDQLTVNIHTLSEPLVQRAHKPLSPEKKHLPLPVASGKTLVFDRDPLAKVLDDLQLAYGKAISYDGNDMASLSFTGRINTAQSLEEILERIAFLNDLTISGTKEGYIVRTHH